MSWRMQLCHKAVHRGPAPHANVINLIIDRSLEQFCHSCCQLSASQLHKRLGNWFIAINVVTPKSPWKSTEKTVSGAQLAPIWRQILRKTKGLSENWSRALVFTYWRSTAQTVKTENEETHHRVGTSTAKKKIEDVFHKWLISKTSCTPVHVMLRPKWFEKVTMIWTR